MINPSRNLVRLGILWAVLFVVCLSLGYPTLNRYDPSTSPLRDVTYYKILVEQGMDAVPDNHWRYRILVPLIARPFAAMADGHIGSWNSTYFGLLVANSLFVAATALLLMLIVSKQVGDQRPGLISALLFLLNFNVSNLYLGGLTDSAEVFAMVMLAFLLMNGHWLWLPILSVVGSFGKETVVPFSAAFAGGWYLAECWKQRKISYMRGAIVILMFGAGLATVIIFRSLFESKTGEVLQLVSSEKSVGLDWWPLIENNLLNKSILYTFGWVAPIGFLGLRYINKPWIWASIISLLAVTLLSLWANAGDNIARPMFSACGPVLVAAASIFLWEHFKNRTNGST
jgi:hypothetical protein